MKTVALFLLVAPILSASEAWDSKRLTEGFFSEDAAIGDINGDGIVDISDFLILNSAFGSACP